MKKLLLGISFLLLVGCQTEFSLPQYYDSEQTITFNYPKEMTLNVEGNEIRENYTAKRSSAALTATLKKSGFQPKQIEVKSSLTGDKWASDGSGFFLMPPFNTLKGFAKGADTGSSFLIFGPLKLILTPVCIVAGTTIGLGLDAYNTIIGIPSVLILNPWYEYDQQVDLSNEILIPTEEFKQLCHQKHMFVGNNSCMACDTPENILATPEECHRCPNRYSKENTCLLK